MSRGGPLARGGGWSPPRLLGVVRPRRLVDGGGLATPNSRFWGFEPPPSIRGSYLTTLKTLGGGSVTLWLIRTTPIIMGVVPPPQTVDFEGGRLSQIFLFAFCFFCFFKYLFEGIYLISSRLSEKWLHFLKRDLLVHFEITWIYWLQGQTTRIDLAIFTVLCHISMVLHSATKSLIEKAQIKKL